MRVDALLGEQTRDHADLDLALELGDLDAAGWRSRNADSNTTRRASQTFLRDLYCETTVVGRLIFTHWF
jgi:hypothetical protein